VKYKKGDEVGHRYPAVDPERERILSGYQAAGKAIRFAEFVQVNDKKALSSQGLFLPFDAKAATITLSDEV